MSIKNYEIGKIDPNLKGAAYDKAIGSALSPENLANCNPAEDSEPSKVEAVESSADEE